MRRVFFLPLVLICMGCLVTRGSVRKEVSPDAASVSGEGARTEPRGQEGTRDLSVAKDKTAVRPQGAAAGTPRGTVADGTQGGGKPDNAAAGDAPVSGDEFAHTADESSRGLGSERPDMAQLEAPAEEEAPAEPASDAVFSSLHSKGLILADGNKWYYENFDKYGRPSFAVLYEADKAVEKTVWRYADSAHYPNQKEIVHVAAYEISRYDDGGRETSVEKYEGDKLVSKVENEYTATGQLKERTVTKGKKIDRSVWEFTGTTATSETKYRNGKKIAFVELTRDPPIIHLYVDGKEVYVGEKR